MIGLGSDNRIITTLRRSCSATIRIIIHTMVVKLDGGPIADKDEMIGGINHRGVTSRASDNSTNVCLDRDKKS